MSTCTTYRQLQPEERLTIAPASARCGHQGHCPHAGPITLYRQPRACPQLSSWLLRSIHVRPPEVEDRQFPGHWEGDLIKGANNASAVGTLVERTSRLLMLVRLPHPQPASAANVLQAFTDKLLSIAEPMRQTLTYDQGREMARHKELTAATKGGGVFL